MSLTTEFQKIKAAVSSTEAKLTQAEALITNAESGVIGWIRKVPAFASGVIFLAGLVGGAVLSRLL